MDCNPRHWLGAAVLVLWLIGCGASSTEPGAARFVGGSAATGVADAAEPAASGTQELLARELAGNWKVSVYLARRGVYVGAWLLGITEGKTQLSAKLLQSSQPTKLVDVALRDGLVLFTLDLGDDELWGFEGKLRGGLVRGSFSAGSAILPAWMEPTDADQLGKEVAKPAPGAEALSEADLDGIRTILRNDADQPVVFDAYRTMIRNAQTFKLNENQVKELADACAGAAEAWGPRWHLWMTANVAYDLNRAGLLPQVALQYARQAQKALKPEAPEALQQLVSLALGMSLLARDQAKAAAEVLAAARRRWGADAEIGRYYGAALEKTGQTDEAIEAYAQFFYDAKAAEALERLWRERHGSLAGLEEKRDAVYRQKVPPFKPEAFAGRKSADADQVVLVELFTGAPCPPCVAADVALDAVAQTYRPTEVVVVQYHVHGAGPDPLTNPASEAREAYYEVSATPSALFNGEEGAPGGGPMFRAEIKYKEYRELIDPRLEETADAELALAATREGDRIEIKADVSGLKQPGPHVRLRLALIEETVRYLGSNGVRFHHAVVRAMPGGAEGVAVTEPRFRHQVEVRLSDVRTELGKYLHDFESAQQHAFDAKPLELEEMGVVAFLQDDKTKQVLQTAYVRVGTGQEKR